MTRKIRVSQIEAAAHEARISWRTFETAKSKLPIVARKEDSRWWWEWEK